MASYARGRDALTVAAIAVIGTIVFSLLFVQMTNRGLSLRRSDLYVRLATAGGLRERDPVMFRGVQVGEVKKLKFMPEGDVVIRTRLLQRVPLTADAHAALVATDMFGRQSLVLREGTAAAPWLLDGDTLRGLESLSVTARLEGLSRNAERLTGDTTALLLHEALHGIGNATDSFARLAEEMRRLIAAQTESVALLTASSAQAAGNIAVATDPDALLRMRGNAEATAETLARTVAQLEVSATTLAAVMHGIEAGNGNAGLLLRDDGLYERTETLLASLEALVSDVKANPKRYINVRVF